MLLLVLLLVTPATAAVAIPSKAPPAPLPACQQSKHRGKNEFDYFLLTTWWPPSVFANEDSYLAYKLEKQRKANSGLWLHGLWPSVSQGDSLLDCNQSSIDVTTLPANITTPLSYWWPGSKTPFSPTSAYTLWSHEWTKHGTCSGMQPQQYFSTALSLSKRFIPALDAALASANVTGGASHQPSEPFSLGELKAVLDGALRGPAYIMTCKSTQSGKRQLFQLQLCLSKTSMEPCDCLGLANGQRVQRGSSCGLDNDTSIWVPAFQDDMNYGGVQNDTIALIVAGCVAGLAALLILVWLVLWQLGFITPLLKPRHVTVVHNPLVHQPVEVMSEVLDLDQLWVEAPSLAAFVQDLPAGMCIKGGVARKVLKRLYGTPEPSGSFDIDCLVLLPESDFAGGHEVTAAAAAAGAAGGTGKAAGKDDSEAGPGEAVTPARAAHDAVTGLHIGTLVLEAQDVEVLPKSHLREYFLTRDVTLNEVLILKDGPKAWLLYSTAAKADAAAGLIRPSCHVLASDMQTYWQPDPKTGKPYIDTNVVCRCLIRYLKGHGQDYAFDPGTWEHYRKHKLDKIGLFKVLRAFHTDSTKLQAAVEHLIEIGFLRRVDVWRAGGANKLWGLLLQEVNASIARHGGRLQLGQLDPEGVEKWVTTKKAQTASKRLLAWLKARRTGWVASEESTESLGLFKLPQQLEDYITTGPTFDYTHFAARRQQQVEAALAGTPEADGLLPPHTIASDTSAAAASCTESGSSPYPCPDSSQPTSASRGPSSFEAAAQSPQAPFVSHSGPPAAPEANTDARRVAWSSMVKAASIAGPRQAAKLVTAALGSAPSCTSGGSGLAGPVASAASAASAAPPSPNNSWISSTGGSSLTTRAHSAAGGSMGPGASTPQAGTDAAVLARQASRRARLAAASALNAAESAQHQQQQQEVAHHNQQAAAAEEAAMGGVLPQSNIQPLMKHLEGGRQPSPGADALWLRYSQMGPSFQSDDTGRFSHLGPNPELQTDQLGTFFTSLDTSGPDAALLKGETSIVDEAERSGKQPMPTWELVAFVMSIMSACKWHMVLAILLTLAAAGAQLLLPLLEGQAFNLLSVYTEAEFVRQIGHIAAAMVAQTVFMTCASLVLEVAAWRVMNRLFVRLFNHIMAQDQVFFNSINKGELMAWLSSGCLALRSLVAVTLINLMVGSLYAVAVVVVLCIMWDVRSYRYFNYFVLLLCLGTAAPLLGAALVGLFAQPLNRKMRQSQGRLFGFLLDVLMHMDAVLRLGLQGTMSVAYKRYADAMFRRTFQLHLISLGERSFSYGLMCLTFLLFLYYGGLEVIYNKTSIGILVATLRYIRVQQRGIKMAADAWVQLRATLGNLERLLALHNKGTLPPACDADDDCYNVPQAGSRASAEGDAAAATANVAGPDEESGLPAAASGGKASPAATAATTTSDVEAGKDPDQAATRTNGLLVHRETRNGRFDGSGHKHRRQQHRPQERPRSVVPSVCAAGLTLMTDVPAAADAYSSNRGVQAAVASAAALFEGMTGGVALRGVSVMVPGRAGRGSVLRHLEVSVLPGQAVLITGSPSEPLAALLDTIGLLNMPYEGQVALQLQQPGARKAPQPAANLGHHQQRQKHRNADAARDTCSAKHEARLAWAHNSHTVVDVATGHTTSCSSAGGGAPGGDGSGNTANATAAAAGLPGCWHVVEHLIDWLPAARAHIAVVSEGTGAVFRASVEDNVACGAVAAAGAAAGRATGLKPVTHAAVADVCRQVGLHEEVAELPDGYFTVVGEGSGFLLSSMAPQQLSLARALLVKPRLLLVGDLTRLAAAVGLQRLLALLQAQLAAGRALLLVAPVQPDSREEWEALALGAELQAQQMQMVQGRLLPGNRS